MPSVRLRPYDGDQPYDGYRSCFAAHQRGLAPTGATLGVGAGNNWCRFLLLRKEHFFSGAYVP